MNKPMRPVRIRSSSFWYKVHKRQGTSRVPGPGLMVTVKSVKQTGHLLRHWSSRMQDLNLVLSRSGDF